jgi:hypothetical protein
LITELHPGFEKRIGMAPAAGRAAQYVRMSTEHQQYSTENQAEVIQQYAARRGLVSFALTQTRERADCGSMDATRSSD